MTIDFDNLGSLSTEQLQELFEQTNSDYARYDRAQKALKVRNNSVYGALNNEFFRWFALPVGEAITLTGQYGIQFLKNEVNQYLNNVIGTVDHPYVIAADTDSIILSLDSVLRKFASNYDSMTTNEKIDFVDKLVEQRIQPIVNEKLKYLFELMNGYKMRLSMKREKIADKAIWTGKKHYVLNVWDSEGTRFDPPKPNFVGIEAVRSDTPQICRENIKEAIKIILNGEEHDLWEFVKKFNNEFKQLQFEDIAFPSGVNNLENYTNKQTIYGKGTPIHVRASLLYNYYVMKNNLTNTYRLITNGDRIKYCYLKIPNPIRENVFAISEVLPPQLDLDRFIDYDLMFEKAFLAPLKPLATAAGMSLERISTLDDFWS